MNKQLIELIDKYKKTDWKKLLREDLGDYHLKEIKPILDKINNIISPLVENFQELSPNQQVQIINLLEQFFQHKYLIENHRDTGQNESIINNITQFKNQILDDSRILQVSLLVQDRYSSDKSLEKKFKEEIKEYQLAREGLEKELKKYQQSQSEYEGLYMSEEAKRYGNFFETEAKENRSLYRIVRRALFVFLIAFGLIAYFYLDFDQSIEAENIFELIIRGEVINKVFIFTVMIFLISLLRREYLALRHQYTLNRHRHNALSSHKEILSSIKETANESDKEISNTVLLELTKAMFSPQDTGFVKDQKSNSSENRIVEISRSLFNKPKE